KKAIWRRRAKRCRPNRTARRWSRSAAAGANGSFCRARFFGRPHAREVRFFSCRLVWVDHAPRRRPCPPFSRYVIFVLNLFRGARLDRVQELLHLFLDRLLISAVVAAVFFILPQPLFGAWRVGHGKSSL